MTILKDEEGRLIGPRNNTGKNTFLSKKMFSF